MVSPWSGAFLVTTAAGGDTDQLISACAPDALTFTSGAGEEPKARRKDGFHVDIGGTINGFLLPKALISTTIRTDVRKALYRTL
jgi:hypothetical protein